MNKGVVHKSTGSWYLIKDEAGSWLQGRIKGKLRIDEDISSTNPVAVGDTVIFQHEAEAGNVVTISEVAKRANYMVRVSPHNKNQKHIIAANLDAALLVATIASPRTSQGFIDRFLITAEAYHIPAIIVFNKTDLLRDKDKIQLAQWQGMYEDAGYTLLLISALDKKSVQPLAERLQGKVTLFSGHSGVGKSTLINQLIPGKELRTMDISDWSGKGQHTTTFAEMHDLPSEGEGSIIDTPGVKEFGLIDIEKEELGHYFPEIKKLMPGCRFNNCLHQNEPGCAVKEAMIAGSMNTDRYGSYLSVLGTIEKNW